MIQCYKEKAVHVKMQMSAVLRAVDHGLGHSLSRSFCLYSDY